MAATVTLGSQLLHGTDSDGARWSVQRDKFTGWDDSAGVTSALAQKPRSSGAWIGELYSQAAHLTIGGNLLADTPEQMLAARDRLKAACSLSGAVLTVDREGSSRWMRVYREDAVLFKELTPTAFEWSVQLVAPDSRKLGEVQTVSTPLPSTIGGLTYPHTFPHSFDAVTNTGQVSLTNDGDVDGPVTLRIYGPVVGPSVTHVTSGRSLTFSPSLSLSTGEWLEVDVDARTVYANGQSSRSKWITDRGWAKFAPGGNTWSFSAAEYNPAALLVVTATSAW